MCLWLDFKLCFPLADSISRLRIICAYIHSFSNQIYVKNKPFYTSSKTKSAIYRFSMIVTYFLQKMLYHEYISRAHISFQKEQKHFSKIENDAQNARNHKNIYFFKFCSNFARSCLMHRKHVFFVFRLKTIHFERLFRHMFFQEPVGPTAPTKILWEKNLCKKCSILSISKLDNKYRTD